MQRRATWKVATAGAALAGLGLVGAGVAQADAPQTVTSPATSVEWLADVDDSLFDSADVSVGAMDDSWDESWEDSWDD